MHSSKLICYELNEVPWRVVDKYIESRPKSFLSRHINEFSQLTTFTRDSGELHPWSTWPTMHRGVTNDIHDIRFINQDLEKANSDYPPVWEILAKNGVSVGVFGSLQSFPVLKTDNTKFYVPDTFSPSADSTPRKAKFFQDFNLKMSQKNKAVASKIKFKDFVSGLNLFRSGISFRTVFRIAKHLLQEKYDVKNKSLRPVIQAYVGFDCFFSLLNKEKPDFVTFFTNHVAGLMHRYWKYSFPEDFGKQKSDFDQFGLFHAESIFKGLDIADEQLERCFKFCQKNGYELIVSTSMGQEAINRGEYIPELQLTNVNKLADLFGCQFGVKLNPAMQPDIALAFANQDDLSLFLENLSNLKDTSGNALLKLIYEPKGLSLNLSVKSSKVLIETETALFKGQAFQLKDLGFKIISRDQGTGYHCPQGVWLWYGSHAPKLDRRQEVDSCCYMPSLLEFYGVEKPAYATGATL